MFDKYFSFICFFMSWSKKKVNNELREKGLHDDLSKYKII